MIDCRETSNVKGETFLGKTVSMKWTLVRTFHFSLFTFHGNHNRAEVCH